jgi:hypothetical protein
MARRPTDPRPAAAKKPAARKRAAPGTKAVRKPAAKSAKSPAAKGAKPVPAADPGRTPAERDRRFNLLLQTACLKAGTASAVGTITRKVPLLGKLAPTLFGTDSEAFSLGRLQHELVRDVIALYDLELSELEERGVILLATAGAESAQHLPRQMAERIVAQLGGRYLQPMASRILPLASLVTDIAGAISGTYAVGKRAQALCNLPGVGNLADLLRGLSGIDERRLFAWSGEALKHALLPLRGVMALRAAMKR